MGDSNVSQSQLSEEFMKDFNGKKDKLGDKISKLSANTGNADATLSEISSEIQTLSKSLHDAVMFLPSYSVKIRQNEIRDLERLLKEKEDVLVPKKKFGFKSKSRPIPTKDTSDVQAEKSAVHANKTAPDMSNYFTIEKLTAKTVHYDEDVLNGNDVLVTDSDNCTIVLVGTPSTLRLANLKNCKLICGPVRTSIFIDKVVDSTLYLCCQQLRTHSSERLDIYLRVASRAIIEDCTNIRFGPYKWNHAKAEKLHSMVGIDFNLQRFDAVDDFNWLSATQSPNWKLIPEEEQKTLDI